MHGVYRSQKQQAFHLLVAVGQFLLTLAAGAGKTIKLEEQLQMSTISTKHRIALSTLLAAAAIGAATLPAVAGECPADQVVADSAMLSDAANKGVMDNVIGSIDLASEAPMLDSSKFRLRRLDIEPGGTVAWHSHAERPAIIYVVAGEIIEHSSTCAVPITHRAGDVSTETHDVSHWWENTSDEPVVLLSTDILHVEEDPNQM